MNLTRTLIKNEIARTNTIFTRGENIFALGNYTLKEKDETVKQYFYTFDGSYGNYDVALCTLLLEIQTKQDLFSTPGKLGIL